MQDWYITTLNPTHSEQALSLICEDFCRNSPLHQATRVSGAEFRNHISKDWHSYAFEGPTASLVALSHSDQQILGCIITSQFPGYTDSSALESTEDLHRKPNAITELLKALEANYLRKHTLTEQSLLVDLASVKANAGNQGIYTKLREAIHKRATQDGFRKIFGALSAAETQRICVGKFGHKVVSEIPYSEFQCADDKPFATITSPPSIQLVKGDLEP